MGYVNFVLANFSALLIAALVADMTLQGREPWRRFLASVAGFSIIVLAVVLTLGVLGRLSGGLISAFCLTIAIAVAILRYLYTKKVPQVLQSKRNPESLRNGIWYLSLGLFAFFAAVPSVKTLLMGTTFNVDALHYHALAPAQWLADERLSLAPANYHAYFPLNAEVLSLWFMLPFHSDAWASLSGFYWTTLAIAAIWALCVLRGMSNSTIMMCVTLFLASNVVLKGGVLAFSAVDLAGAAAVLAAIAMSIPSLDNNTYGSRLTDAMYSGLLAGFAIGCKISFAPVAVILALWFSFGRREILSRTIRTQSAILFGMGAGLTGSYWYLGNILLTGNPLFPAEIGLFEGPFGQAEQYRTKLVSWLLSAPTWSFQEWKGLFRIINWHWSLGVLALVGYIIALRPYVLSRTRDSDKASNDALFLLLITGVTLIILHPLMPFSGSTNSSDAPLSTHPRYLIAPFAIGLIFYSTLINSDSVQWKFWFAISVLALVTTGIGEKIVVIAWFTSAIVILFMPRLMDKIALVKAKWITAMGALMTALILLSAWTPIKQRLTDKNLHKSSVGDKWISALDTVPKGARVAAFGPLRHSYYPLFGRLFEMIPVQINSDGSLRQQLHEKWIEEPIQWWWMRAEAAEPQMNLLLKNLKTNNIEFVLISKTKCGEWPVQHTLLSEYSDIQLVFSDDHSAVWQIQM